MNNIVDILLVYPQVREELECMHKQLWHGQHRKSGIGLVVWLGLQHKVVRQAHMLVMEHTQTAEA